MSTGEVVSPITDMSAHRRRFMGLPSVADRNRVRRNLFGPVDHDETRRFCQRENERSQRRDSQFYNFDFVKGVPLPAGSFQWERVEQHVHHSYALRGMPYCSQHAEDSPATLPSTSRTSESEHEQQPSTATSSTSTTVSTSSCSSSSSCGNVASSGENAEHAEGACCTSRNVRLGTSRTRDAKSDDNPTRTRQTPITDFLKQRKRVSSSSASVSTTSSGATKTKVPKTTSS